MEERHIGNDERADPRIVQLLRSRGFACRSTNPPLSASTASMAKMIQYLDKSERAIELFDNANFSELMAKDLVTVSTVSIQGVDGNDITLYIHSPIEKTGNIPCVFQIHGGGMSVLRAGGPVSSNWRNLIASHGMICVGVEFRNSAGALGPHPFPAGLNDCYTGLEWLHNQRAALGISKIIVAGESGGANLSLALAFKCKRLNTLHYLDGVFGQCPYVSGRYESSPSEDISTRFPSLAEFGGYVLTLQSLEIMAAVYTPQNRDAFRNDPLAWPLAATVEDLRGLPPHIIVVNELDPLRDEGLAYFRKLQSAGVTAGSMTLNGTTHAAEILYVECIPNISRMCIAAMKMLAESL
jgi:acetyl esterase